MKTISCLDLIKNWPFLFQFKFRWVLHENTWNKRTNKMPKISIFGIKTPCFGLKDIMKKYVFDDRQSKLWESIPFCNQLIFYSSLCSLMMYYVYIFEYCITSSFYTKRGYNLILYSLFWTSDYWSHYDEYIREPQKKKSICGQTTKPKK